MLESAPSLMAVTLLEELHLVRKVQHPDNASAILVSRTNRGTALSKRMVEVRDRHLISVLDKWSRGDKDQLADLLDRLVRELEQTPYQSKPRRT